MQNVSLKINGMSCGHCVMAVKGALNALPGVTIQEVKVGSAIVTLEAPATVGAVCAAIDDAGYEVAEAK